MKEQELTALLRSGDFTIVYTDSGECQLFKGKKLDMDDIQNEYVNEFVGTWDGYIPEIVERLVSALNGEVKTY